jgi:hypothetical protein
VIGRIPKVIERYVWWCSTEMQCRYEGADREWLDGGALCWTMLRQRVWEVRPPPDDLLDPIITFLSVLQSLRNC